MRDALDGFGGGRLVVLTAGHPYRCPAAPYEAAMLLEHACRRRGIRAHTQVEVYAAEPGPMGVAGPEVSRMVRQMIESRGIAYHPEHQVQSVEVGARRLQFANGKAADFDLLAYVPPHRVPRVVCAAGLAADGGYVQVDRGTMQTRFDRVFALGDVTSIALAIGKPLPKAGVFASAQAEVVANNIVHVITGRGRASVFDGHGMCFLEMGGNMAGLGRGNFYAEPAPAVKMHMPGPHWHIGKVLLEKYWLRRWF
jgi:sulfide:quinone oxidoreductase